MVPDVAMRLIAASVLAAALQASAQVPSSPPQRPAPAAGPAAPGPETARQLPTRLPTESDRRHAARLYIAAATLYKEELFEEAFKDYQEAARLDPANPDYAMALEVARSHAVTALIQESARDRTRGDTAAAQAALQRAQAIDPGNTDVAQHLRELAEPALYSTDQDGMRNMPQLAPPIQLEPIAGNQSFHIHAPARQVIERVYKAYGIDATVDDSIRNSDVRLDVDDVDYSQAEHVLGLVTESFATPIDGHRVVVARDTRPMRERYMHNAVETFYLPGMNATEMTDFGNIARNIFEVRRTAVNPTAGTITLEAPERDLKAFNSTYRGLSEGRPQVLLDVRILALAHQRMLNTGAQPPQSFTAFNVYAEEQALLSQNAALVQQIIASGLAAPGDTLTILGILLASGQISSSLFNNGIVLFGGGLTLSGISPEPFTFNLNLNSSESRELDDFQLRLADNEDGTMKSGTRYPIITSTLSSTGSGLNIPGLNLPGTSGSLSSLLSSVTSQIPNIPQIQYQDLGLVLKARPRILRSGAVALNLDMKITALAGSSVNGVPVLANRSYTGDMISPAGQAVVIAGELDRSETRAISGLPGLSEIPGLSDITEKTTDQNYSTLLIILTPHVVRSPFGLFRGPMLPVEQGTSLP
jgi:general secretion pathway protein D